MNQPAEPAATPGEASTLPVFVYGTLRQGGSHAHRMAGARWLGPAVVCGRLFRIAWYPGLRLDPAAGPVRGELWQVDDGHLAALDEFEGCAPGNCAGGEFRRVRAAVRPASGGVQTAWVWEWIGTTAGLEELPGGDWLAAGATAPGDPGAVGGFPPHAP